MNNAAIQSSPTWIVVFGASGDMARRLLFPALARLEESGQLGATRILGVALDSWDSETFRRKLSDAIQAFEPGASAETRRALLERVSYFPGGLAPETFEAVARRVGTDSAVFYLALPPGLFARAAGFLAGAGLQKEGSGFRRLVIEKPFGMDLESAQALNKELHAGWAEDQIYRIDHFLGKETVQNLLVFRFGNRFVDPVLNASHVAEVQITAAETLGLEGRYRYYDGIGALRDMVQNHLMQLLTFTAIEPPATWDGEIIRDHKVEVLKAVRPLDGEDLDLVAARGQYGRGEIDGQAVKGYRDEPEIPAVSATETFAAIRLMIDSWRWKGVPFYLRSGKRLSRGVTEIAIRFHEPPTALFRGAGIQGLESNLLRFRLRPEESIDLVARSRLPGIELSAREVTLHADYAKPDERESDPYERLVLDVLNGDHTSFLRYDEVEWAWRILDPVLKHWQSGTPEPYAAGSSGPEGQAAILTMGHRWRALEP